MRLLFKLAGNTVTAFNISGQANRCSAKVTRETMLSPLLDAAPSISRMLSIERG